MGPDYLWITIHLSIYLIDSVSLESPDRVGGKSQEMLLILGFVDQIIFEGTELQFDFP